MNCPKCNYDNDDNALFCANCGAKLEVASPYSPVNEPAANGSAQQFPAYSEQPSAQDAPGGQGSPNQQPPFPTYGQQGANGTNAPYANYYYNPAPRPGQERDWAAITALVCGILSLPCCFTIYGGVIMSVCAIVFGIIGIKSSKKAMSIVGLCLGVVGLICAVLMVVTFLSLSDSYMQDILYDLENAMQL